MCLCKRSSVLTGSGAPGLVDLVFAFHVGSHDNEYYISERTE